MRVEKNEVYTLSNDLHLNEVLEIHGTLRFDPNKSVKLTSTKNIINYGVFEKHPASDKIIHETAWTGIDMQKFVGGGTEPIETDIGLWNMAGGVMKWEGAYKKPFTNSTTTIKAGATSVSVLDVTGWKVGDIITICPTEKPTMGGRKWDDKKKEYVDIYVDKFEDRKITRITGKTVFFSEPLKYDHNIVTVEKNLLAPNGRRYAPFVVNQTRNVKVHGEENGRAHIFSCAHGHGGHHHEMVHSVKNVQHYHLGPRKVGSHRYAIPETILGRYAMHFHHAGDGTTGTIVEGCSFHDIGSRCFVPHLANGITFRNNGAVRVLGELGWCDTYNQTKYAKDKVIDYLIHNTTYDGNIGAGILWDGVQLGGTAFQLGMGDNNRCINNWLVYANQGDEQGSGGYQWTADNESVWEFDNNGAMACNNADWTWQNSGRPHAITRSQTVNCNFGLTHGAYQNAYIYKDCEWYNSLVHIRASQGVYGAGFIHNVFDGMNQLPHTVEVLTSAVGSWANQFKECEFKNAPLAVELDLFKHNDNFAKPRQVELINNKYINVKTKASFKLAKAPVSNCYFRIQDGDKAVRLDPPNKETAIPKFAPNKYGIGEGLKAEYFNGLNFETKVFERVDAFVRHDDWAKEIPLMPTGVHYKIGDKFSVRFTGQIEPYYSENHIFRLNGGSGFRLWIDGQLIIDSPESKHDNAANRLSKQVSLIAGKKYSIKIEVYEHGDKKSGILFYWYSPSMGTYRDVDMSQLYSNKQTNPQEPEPQEPEEPEEPQKPPTMVLSSGEDRVISGSVVVLSGTPGFKKYKWSKVKGGAANIRSSGAVTTEIIGLNEGEYVFRLTADGQSDEVKVSVIKEPDPEPIPDPTPEPEPTPKTITKIVVHYSDNTTQEIQ